MIPSRSLTTSIVSRPAISDPARESHCTSIDDRRRIRVRRSCQHGFTLFELLPVLAIIAILIGILGPAVEKVKEAALRAQMQSDLNELCKAMKDIFDMDGEFPLDISDGRFVDPGLKLLTAPLVARIKQGLDPNYGYLPYFKVSVRVGQPGDRTKWDFRIATSPQKNPIAFGAGSFYDDGFTIDKSGVIHHAKIFHDGADIFLDDPDGSIEWWPWQINSPPPPTGFKLQIALLTARAAEIVTPMLEAHPEASSRVRPYLMNSDNIKDALEQFTPAWFDPFDDIIPADEAADALAGMDLTSLPGDPTFLFSYESLRMLSTLYSGDQLVTRGLIAKLNAAEAAEAQHNLKAKQGQLKAFQLQVSAQSGKALSADHARVLMALAKTL